MANNNPSDIEQIGDLPVCPGCGLISHISHGDICGECFHRREGWCGGGPVRVVPGDGDIHTTPLCPDFDGGKWVLWRDESALYYTMSSDNDYEYCETCRYSNLQTGTGNVV